MNRSVARGRRVALVAAAPLVIALAVTGCSSGSATSSSPSPSASMLGPNNGDKLPKVPGYTYTNTPQGMTVIGEKLASSDHILNVLSAGAVASGASSPSSAVIVGFFDTATADAWAAQSPATVTQAAAAAAQQAIDPNATLVLDKIAGKDVSVLDFGKSALVVAYLGKGVMVEIGGNDTASARAFAKAFLASA